MSKRLVMVSLGKKLPILFIKKWSKYLRGVTQGLDRSEVLLNFSAIALLSFPIFSLKLSAIFAIFFVAMAVATFLFTQERKAVQSNRMLFLLLTLALPCFYFSELIYTTDVKSVWTILQTKLGWLFIPLAFYLIHQSGKQLKINYLLAAFVFAVVLVILKVIFFVGLHGTAYYFNGAGNASFLFRNAVEQIAGLHPTYLGLCVAIAIIVLVYHIISSYHQSKIAWRLLVPAIGLLIFLLTLAARMVILSLMVSLVVLIFKQVKRQKKRLRFLLATLSFMAVASLFGNLHQRLDEFFSPQQNPTTIRKQIYNCAIDILATTWRRGTGVEYLQKELNTCYTTKGYTMPREATFNTHNEYLNVFCAKGIIGFVLFLVLLALMMLKARKSSLPLSILLLFILVFLTENLLDRQVGVFLFSICLGLFFIYQDRVQDGYSNKKDISQVLSP